MFIYKAPDVHIFGCSNEVVWCFDHSFKIHSHLWFITRLSLWLWLWLWLWFFFMEWIEIAITIAKRKHSSRMCTTCQFPIDLHASGGGGGYGPRRGYGPWGGYGSKGYGLGVWPGDTVPVRHWNGGQSYPLWKDWQTPMKTLPSLNSCCGR